MASGTSYAVSKFLLEIKLKLSYNSECRERAEVAQLVEQLIRNQSVGGSTPLFSTSVYFLNIKECCHIFQFIEPVFFSSRKPNRYIGVILDK